LNKLWPNDGMKLTLFLARLRRPRLKAAYPGRWAANLNSM